MENQSSGAVNQNIGQQPGVPVSQKYGVFKSLQEMLGGAKRNPITFAIALIVSYVLAGIALTLTLFAMASLLLGQFGLLFASFGKIITVLLVGLIIYTLLYALAYAFTVSSMAFSLSSEKNSAITVLKRALAVTPRMVKVNAWVAVIAYWPIAVAAFLPLLLLSGARVGNSPLAILTPLLVLGALIWAIIAHLRYALAPYVAIFEPDVPVKQTLRRSQELLKTGGQWFIFKGFLLLLAILILLGIVTKSSLKELDNTNSWTINIIFIILSILIEGALIMLYFNRANKHDPSSTPKSPQLLALVIVILVGLFGLAAWQSQSNKVDDPLSKTNQEILAKITHDIERTNDINALSEALENYYKEHGYYPEPQLTTNYEWASKNMIYTPGADSGTTKVPVQEKFLIDPSGKNINTEGGDYQYKASPDNCTQCASFELIAKLEEGIEYKKASLNNAVKTSNASTQSQPVASNTSTTQQPTITPAKTDTATVLYRVAADGSSAQVSPVTTSLTGPTAVELTVELQCLGTCQFKLVSDTFSFSNTTTYTSTQNIKYLITKPGEYIFYNQFTPSTKFKIKF